MTLTNVVRTIFDHLRNGQKIVRTTFVRVIVTKPSAQPLHSLACGSSVNLLKTSPKYAQARVYGKCVL